MKSYVSLLSAHVPALLTGAENPATSPDMSIAAIRATLAEDGVTAAQKLFHVLVMNVRGPALALIRYAPNTAPRAQSLMSAIFQCKDLSLRAHSVRDRTGRMATEHSQVRIDFWRPFQRVNEESSLSRTTNLHRCESHFRCKTWLPSRR